MEKGAGVVDPRRDSNATGSARGKVDHDSKPTMPARSLPPTITTQPFKEFGEAVIKAMEERLNLSLTGEARQLFQLPLRKGGVGFCSPAETAPYAFLAGVADSSQTWPYCSMGEDVKGWVSEEKWFINEIDNCLSRYITPGVEWPEKEGLTNATDFGNHFSAFGKRKRSERLQARLTDIYRQQQREQLKNTLSKEMAARMQSRSSRNTALIWKAYPLTTNFALTDEEMRFSVAYATGQRLPHMPDRCGCAKETALTMEHSVHCAEKLTRHNMLQERLVTFARLHGVTTRQNPRYHNQDAKERLEPDVVFYPAPHAPVQTDVTVVNPCAPFRLKGERGGFRFATKNQKALKNRKYLARAKERGNMFASKTPMDRGLALTDMQLDLAITLARGNARAASTTIAWAQRARDSRRALHPLSADDHSGNSSGRRRK